MRSDGTADSYYTAAVSKQGTENQLLSVGLNPSMKQMWIYFPSNHSDGAMSKQTLLLRSRITFNLQNPMMAFI